MSMRIVSVLRALIFISLALLLCGVIFEFAGFSSLLMFQSVIEGAFLRSGAWDHSLRWALPLFITATGVGISFRCGFFNIGAQGQFYIGAICAAFVADCANDLAFEIGCECDRDDHRHHDDEIGRAHV